MNRAIHGPNEPHSVALISLWNIGIVYHKQKRLNQAAEFLGKSLEMIRNVHARDSLDLNIRNLLSDLADVYDYQRRRDEAAAIRERKE